MLFWRLSPPGIELALYQCSLLLRYHIIKFFSTSTKLKTGENKLPYIACQRCGTKLDSFEVIYTDAKFCRKCMNAPREG